MLFLWPFDLELSGRFFSTFKVRAALLTSLIFFQVASTPDESLFGILDNDVTSGQ